MYMIRVDKTLRPWNFNFVACVKLKYVENLGREKIILFFHIYVYYIIMCVDYSKYYEVTKTPIRDCRKNRINLLLMQMKDKYVQAQIITILSPFFHLPTMG